MARRSDVSEPSAYTLKGAGLSLKWIGPNGLSANVIWAHRTGTNPNPIADLGRSAGVQGFDQDGSLDRNRIWVSVAKQF